MAVVVHGFCFFESVQGSGCVLFYQNCQNTKRPRFFVPLLVKQSHVPPVAQELSQASR